MDGITGAASRTVQAAVGLAGSVLDAISGPKGIDAHSPSKKAIDIISYVPDGFVVALRGGERRVQEVGEGLAARAVRMAWAANDNSPSVASRRMLTAPPSNDVEQLAAPRARSAGGGEVPPVVIHVTVQAV